MNKEIRDQYDHNTFHPEVIDIAFGFLKPENASTEANIIFEESGLQPYIKSRGNIVKDIEKTIKLGTSDVDILLGNLTNQNTYRNMELSTILSHLLQTRKPLSYKLVSYDEIKLNEPQKFITATSNIFGPALKDITLITGTGNKLHANHLEKFITDHVNNNQGTNETGNMEGLFNKLIIDSRINSSIYTLKGGWFKKESENKIHVYNGSGGYGTTSNITALEIFRNLFPDHKITTNTK